MKKAILIMLAITFITINVSATYCDIAPQLQDCVCRQITETDQLGNIIAFEEIPEFASTSLWANLYCESSGGTMRQSRTAFQIIKPECEERFIMTQYQSVSNNLCRNCPDPKLLGSWQARQCVGSKTLSQRDVIAYYFLPDVTDCELGRFIEFSLEDEGICSTPGGSIVLDITNNWIAVAALMLLGFGAVIIFLLKRKGRF